LLEINDKYAVFQKRGRELMERRRFARMVAFSSVRLFTADREFILDGDLLHVFREASSRPA